LGTRFTVLSQPLPRRRAARPAAEIRGIHGDRYRRIARFTLSLTAQRPGIFLSRKVNAWWSVARRRPSKIRTRPLAPSAG
jgi:hypothetical protein